MNLFVSIDLNELHETITGIDLDEQEDEARVTCPPVAALATTSSSSS